MFSLNYYTETEAPNLFWITKSKYSDSQNTAILALKCIFTKHRYFYQVIWKKISYNATNSIIKQSLKRLFLL